MTELRQRKARLLLAALVSAALGLGSLAQDHLSLGVSSPLPLGNEVSVRLMASWANLEVRFEASPRIGSVDSSFSLTMSAADRPSTLRWELQATGGDYYLAARLELATDRFTLSPGLRLNLSSIQGAIVDTAFCELAGSPAEGIRLAGKVAANGGNTTSEASIAWDGHFVDLSLARAWINDDVQESSVGLRVPSAGLGLVHTVPGTSGGVAQTRWIAIPPQGNEPNRSGTSTRTPDGWPGGPDQPRLAVCATDGCPPGCGDPEVWEPVDFGPIEVDARTSRVVEVPCPPSPAHLHKHNVWRLEVDTPSHAAFSVSPLATTWRSIEETLLLTLAFEPDATGPFDETLSLCLCTAHQYTASAGVGCEDAQVRTSLVVDGVVCTPIRLRATGTGVTKPVAEFEYSPADAISDEEVHFDAERSRDTNPGGEIVQYIWTFSDTGKNAYGRATTHTFKRVGDYKVTLVVVNDAGLRSLPAEKGIPVHVNTDIILPSVAVGVGTYFAMTSPPLLLPSRSGYCNPISETAIQSYSTLSGRTYEFVAGQLIVQAPEDIGTSKAKRAIRTAVPDADFVGFLPSLNAHLIEVPTEDEEQDLIDWIYALDGALPPGYSVTKNYVGHEESAFCDGPSPLGHVQGDERVILDTIRTEEAFELLCDYEVHAEANVHIDPVRVAIIETGLDADHEDFKELADCRRICGRSYVAGGGEDTLRWYADTDGHGTKVGGIIGAANNNVEAVGLLAAVCGEFELHVYRYHKDLASLSDCIEKAAGATLDRLTDAQDEELPALGFRTVVINLSLGTDPPQAASFRKLFRDHPDVLFVCSAGNEGLVLPVGVDDVQLPHAPGGIDEPNCITVAATNPKGTELVSTSRWKSNRGPGVDIAAPGSDVYTTLSDGTWDFADPGGTSYAAALVCGVAATVRAIDPSLKPEDVKRILTSHTKWTVPDSSRDPKDPLPLLDFQSAVAQALKSCDENKLKAFLSSTTSGSLSFLLLLLFP